MSALNKYRVDRWLAPGLILGCVLILVLAGCGSTSAANTTPTATVPPAPTATIAPTAAATTATVASGQIAITIQGFAFSPQSITIKAGSTVTWTDKDAVAHTVTSLSGPASFNSGALTASGGTFKFTFTQPGTYSYHCMIHPSMMATIVVVS